MAMPIDHLRSFFSRQKIAPCHLLLALSGGVDSTAALLVLRDLVEEGFTLSAAHINHHLREDDSAEDERFARMICARFAIPIEVERGPLDQRRLKDVGVEAAAREIRYSTLEIIRRRVGADYIVTAHQKNDQAETVLMRLLTSSSPASLAGIREVNSQRILRPFLQVERSDFQAVLQGAGIEPRRDRMNQDPRFLRSRVRSELMPVLLTYNGRILDALASVAARGAATEALLDELIERAAATSIERSEDSSRFTLESLPPNALLRRAILSREICRLDPLCREVSAEDLQRIDDQLPTLKKISVTRELELEREGRYVLLRRRLKRVLPFEVTVGIDEPVVLPSVALEFAVRGPMEVPGEYSDPDRNRQIFQLPAGEATEELRFLIRTPRPGDLFQPLGLEREKKLSEFLIDRKIARNRRASLPLLTWNDRIVWIPGVEVSEQFKVRDRSLPSYEARIRKIDEPSDTVVYTTADR